MPIIFAQVKAESNSENLKWNFSTFVYVLFMQAVN